jgi:hypothetical protein
MRRFSPLQDIHNSTYTTTWIKLRSSIRRNLVDHKSGQNCPFSHTPKCFSIPATHTELSILAANTFGLQYHCPSIDISLILNSLPTAHSSTTSQCSPHDVQKKMGRWSRSLVGLQGGSWYLLNYGNRFTPFRASFSVKSVMLSTVSQMHDLQQSPAFSEAIITKYIQLQRNSDPDPPHTVTKFQHATTHMF